MMVWGALVGSSQQVPSRAPIVTDTFTRADSALTLGNAETGQAWTAQVGTWGISSNQAYSVTDADADKATVTAVADGTVQANVSGAVKTGDYREPQLLFRFNSATVYLMLSIYTTVWRIYKCADNGGAEQFTVLASGTVTAPNDATPYELKAVLSGNSVTAYYNDGNELTHTLAGGDTAYAAYAGVGFRLSKGGSPAVNARYDDLEVI